MSKYRKKVVIVEAFQWFKHGDVPEVGPIPLKIEMGAGRRAKLGWLDTPQGGHIIFPGDWILIDSKGAVASCNALTFARLYEPADSKILPMPGSYGKAA